MNCESVEGYSTGVRTTVLFKGGVCVGGGGGVETRENLVEEP